MCVLGEGEEVSDLASIYMGESDGKGRQNPSIYGIELAAITAVNER